MSERLSLREPSGANPAWLAVPLCDSLLPSFFHRYPRDEGVAGDGGGGAGMWPVADGRPHLRVAPLSTQGALLSQRPSLVGTGCDRVYTSGRLPLCLPAWIRYPQPPRLDSLAARVSPLRRRRREGANRSVDEVRPLGGPRGWKPLVLNPPGAVADFRALVFHRRCRYPMSGADGSYLA